MEVTVLLVVHNCEMYIAECIQSVLCQTYKDFELLIIDDGSTDGTLSKIEQFKDQRIRLISNSCNDYIFSLNQGLRLAKGKYIARMDGDDVMHLERLERQVEVMNFQTDITVCSSWFQCFGSYNEIVRGYSGLIDNPLVQMLKGNIIAHPTSMLRKSFLEKYNLLYKNYQYAEDYNLWKEIVVCGGKIWVIPDILLRYRCSLNQISCKKQVEQRETSLLIKKEILDYLFKNYRNSDESLNALYRNLFCFNEKEELSAELIFDVFYEIFSMKQIKNEMI
ncbi:glycosyltransferase [Bacteroides fragilis]|jgi:glycosyltransferase involved in cell wall biosynthesis|uniref:glycosyltransferase family 2 protein n=1 Tax=Bacteroides hominis TaxID=2763023 RepID=UPI0029408BFE|nr:glycosyltransferase [Bacteroides fragilis]MCX8462964.1 glycosyltransferase [Bacteroides fragilis]